MFTSSSVIFVYSTPLYLYNPDLITFKKIRLSTLKMDRFLYLDEYRVLICKQCAYAVPPTYLTSHLKRHLHQYSGFENRAALSALEKQLRGFSLVNPLEENVVFPGPDRPPLPGVPLHNGFRCRDCFYITTSLTWIKQHTQSHQPIRKGRGRPRKFASASLDQTQPLWDNIYCQRFFVSGPQSQYFQVTPPLHPAASSQTDLIRDQVYERIRQLEQQEEQQNQTITAASHRTAVHPWLERTRWQDYTQGYTFTELAALAYMPDPEQEPLLQLWIESLDYS
jgi:hypothetical protein